MRACSKTSGSQLRLGALAEFRYELRRFLHFSECAAVESGLQPQQHQLLLQVAGAPEGQGVTIAYAAERLSLRHHSVVELVNRSQREGLLMRSANPVDRRHAILQVTRKGERLLNKLADSHARELNELAPRLAKSLQRIRTRARSGILQPPARVHGSLNRKSSSPYKSGKTVQPTGSLTLL
jgi:DNA-binding MarR family transcriptional regulator